MSGGGVLQPYKKQQVAYGSRESSIALEERERNRDWSKQSNYGSIQYTDLAGESHREFAVSSGSEHHTEELLIGAELLRHGKAVSPGKPDFTVSLRTLRQGKVEIYTERHPCTNCDFLLNSHLGTDDVVYWTVSLGLREHMEEELAGHMAIYQQEVIERELRRDMPDSQELQQNALADQERYLSRIRELEREELARMELERQEVVPMETEVKPSSPPPSHSVASLPPPPSSFRDRIIVPPLLPRAINLYSRGSAEALISLGATKKFAEGLIEFVTRNRPANTGGLLQALRTQQPKYRPT